MNQATFSDLDLGEVVAVTTVDSVEQALPLGEALLAGGVKSLELTLRTPAALDALALLSDRFPELLVGAGTVLSEEQLRQAHEAGAAFAVSPGLNPTTVEAARAQGLPFAPGVATPTEMELAVSLGCLVMKFFPAGELGGLKYLRTASIPFQHLGVQFLPLGGVKPENVGEYLADPLVFAVGGSWIASPKAIAEGDWAGIEGRAREARKVADGVRG